MYSFPPSGLSFSRLDNRTFSSATSPFHTSFPSPGFPAQSWLSNPTWKYWATPCPAQCLCPCSWAPGCWSATVEWCLNVLLTSHRFALRAAFFFLAYISSIIISYSSYKRNCRIRIYRHFFLFVSATFVLIFVLYTFVLFCVFVCSWCIGGFEIFPGGNFSDRAFYGAFVFSATLQNFWQPHHYSTAPSFILFLLFYALCVSSRKPTHASFSKGGILI